MSRLMSKLLALLVLAPLGTALAAADDKPEPVKLTKLTEMASATGGIASPDGKLLAVSVVEKYEKKQGNVMFEAGSYHRVKLIESVTGKELAAIPGATASCFSASGKVLCVQQSFDEQFLKAGKLFAATSIMPMPQLWDVTNPQKPKQLFVVDGATQESLSLDSKLLLVAGGPEQKFGNAGKVIAGLPRAGNAAKLGGGANGGGFFFTGVSLRYFELWEVDSAKFVARYEPQPKGKTGIQVPVLSPDAKLVTTVVTGTPGKNKGPAIALYDVDNKKEARRIELNDAHVIQEFGFSCDKGGQPLQFVPSHVSPGDAPSHLLAAAIADKDDARLNLYDPSTGKLVTTLHKEKLDGNRVMLDYSVSPDGKTLVAVVQRRPAFQAVQPRMIGGGGVLGGVGGMPAPGNGANGGQGGFGGAGGKPMPVPPAKGQAQAAPAPRGPAGDGGNVALPQFGNPFGGGMMQIPPASGEIIVFDLENRAKKYTLAVLPHAAQFASDSVLAIVVFDDKSLKLKLLDVATTREIGGLDDCDLVHFSADGTTMLTRTANPNAPVVKAWKVEKAKQ